MLTVRKGEENYKLTNLKVDFDNNKHRSSIRDIGSSEKRLINAMTTVNCSCGTWAIV